MRKYTTSVFSRGEGEDFLATPLKGTKADFKKNSKSYLNPGKESSSFLSGR